MFEPPSRETNTPAYVPVHGTTNGGNFDLSPLPVQSKPRRWRWVVAGAAVFVLVFALVVAGLLAAGDKPEPRAAVKTEPVAELASLGSGCPINGMMSEGVNGIKLRCTEGLWASVEPPKPQTFSVAGMFTVIGATCKKIESGERWGYADIPGSEVRVMAAGEILGVTRLDEKGIKLDPGTCSYAFRVDDVEAGHDFYSVEVGRRGELTYTQDEVQEILDLTIGD